MRGANRVQQPDERDAIFLTQSLERFLLRARRVRVDLFQQRESIRGNPAEVLPPILRAALPANESLGFEAVEQPGDAGRLFDHPFGDLERGETFVSRASQDPQDVELLERDAMGLDDGGRLAPDQIGGPHQPDDGFVGGRLEGPALAKLALQGRGHGSYITRQ